MQRTKRNALGRGLDALISINDVDPGGSSTIREIAVDNIIPNPDQPRRDFDEEALDELAASIRELGIVQPLTLRLSDDGTHQIIAGERRWRAARKAGLATVPAYVRTASDSEVTEMALIENIQRQDLNAVEVALAFKKLIDVYNLTQERLSERIGKKRTTVTNHLRLLNLPAEIQMGLRDRKLDMGHARALLSIGDPKKQLEIYKKILKEGLSVRRVEQLAREASSDTQAGGADKPSAGRNPLETYFMKEVAGRFPGKASIVTRANGRGSISFNFTSEKEMKALIDILDRLKP